MTRPLHKETEVQRAHSSEAASEAERERGYEVKDVPPGKVALALVGLLGLMVVGLAVSWGELAILRENDHPLAPPFADVPQVPPEPRLLTGINRDDHRFSHPPVRADDPPPPPLRRAMEEVARQGWGTEAPSTPAADPAGRTAAAARAHLEAGR